MSLYDAYMLCFPGFWWFLWFRCLFPAACWDAWSSSAYFHRNLQLFRACSNGVLELFIIRISEIAASQLPRSVCRASVHRQPTAAFPFVDLLLTCHTGCLSFCKPPPGPQISFRSFLIQYIVIFVNPVHESDKVRSPSTFQSSLIRFSCTTSRFAWVVLITSIYFSGIGNDSSFGAQRWIRGSTWWRLMKSPWVDRKSLRRHLSFRLLVWLRLHRVSPEGLLSDRHTLQVDSAFDGIFGLHNLFQAILPCRLRMRIWIVHAFWTLKLFFLRWVFEHGFLTCPIFPAPQCLHPKMSLFQILPRNQCVSEEYSRWNVLAKLVEPWLVFRRNRKIFNHCSEPQIVSHEVFSHLPRGLEHFVDNSSIP